MSWLKNMALLTLAALVLVVVIALFPGGAPPQSAPANGTFSPIEFGTTGDYGFLTFFYNGTGNITLLSLSEKPKTRVIVLKQDYLETERYSYLMDEVRTLEQDGFFVNESDSIAPMNNSVIIIPSGAMPDDLLLQLDSLAADNKIIYIGKTNLVYSTSSSKLQEEHWLDNISNSTRANMTIIEKPLDEFYNDHNFSVIDDIRTNSWALSNSASFNYSGDGKKTVFIALDGGKWLRALSPRSDSRQLPDYSNVSIDGPSEIFPWEKGTLTVVLNYSVGITHYRVEKDGAVLSEAELDRVRGEEAFYIPLVFSAPGDYLVRIYDQSGTIRLKRIHVKDLNITLSGVYGNFYEFSFSVDGKPVDQVPIVVGLNHSNNTMNGEITNGKFSLRAQLNPGRNIFVISIFGANQYVPYDNNQEGVLQFYAKYLLLGALLVGGFYLFMRMNKKPMYRILVPESVPGRTNEVKLNAQDMLSAMREVESGFGWEGVPLYAKELATGLKKLTNGMDVTEGNIEAVMKKLEEKGLVRSHMGLYGLAEWGDQKQNALRRVVRDKLMENGIEFYESASGFKCRDWSICFSLEKAGKDSLLVFEDREERSTYVASLDEKKRSALEIKVANGVLKLATLDELDELL